MGGLKTSENLNEKAIKIALERLKMTRTRTPPEILKSRSRWNPVLLRNISEVTVRANDRSVIVRQDIDTGETIGWRYSDTPPSSTQINITKEEALDIALSEIEIPDDAVLDTIDLMGRGNLTHVYVAKWKHLVNGIEVENDYIIVKINPESKEVISVTTNWSEVNE